MDLCVDIFTNSRWKCHDTLFQLNRVHFFSLDKKLIVVLFSSHYMAFAWNKIDFPVLQFLNKISF
jgi:hypothetical protein